MSYLRHMELTQLSPSSWSDWRRYEAVPLGAPAKRLAMSYERVGMGTDGTSTLPQCPEGQVARQRQGVWACEPQSQPVVVPQAIRRDPIAEWVSQTQRQVGVLGAPLWGTVGLYNSAFTPRPSPPYGANWWLLAPALAAPAIGAVIAKRWRPDTTGMAMGAIVGALVAGTGFGALVSMLPAT